MIFETSLFLRNFFPLVAVTACLFMNFNSKFPAKSKFLFWAFWGLVGVNDTQAKSAF